jgi:hypothetical protein
MLTNVAAERFGNSYINKHAGNKKHATEKKFKLKKKVSTFFMLVTLGLKNDGPIKRIQRK